MKELEQILPVTSTNVSDAYAFMFAPWVQQLGLCDFEARQGYVRARLPESDALKLVAGSLCGQALMAAIDTVAALAMCTTDRVTKGTVNQHTQFLRPARGGDLFVEVSVLRFGKATAYAEAHVKSASGDLIAHAVTEYAF